MKNAYESFAERYDWMREEIPDREDFFSRLFEKYSVKTILDCACGTGMDLIMLHRLKFSVAGSDVSDKMLVQAKRNIAKAGLNIPLQKADYRQLPCHYKTKFDAVVCLGNAINEVLSDIEIIKALKSMKAVLRPGGIIVLDQGQTDSSMLNPPRFVPVVNNRNYTRFFAIDYKGNIQTVNIFDFVHTKKCNKFFHAVVHVKIRLQNSWEKLLRKAEFFNIEFFGNWKSTPYSRESSSRLIVVAKG